MASKLFGMEEWAVDEETEKARRYRRTQQAYINKMMSDLKDRLASNDETPSILGNIFRQGLLNDEELHLASYTGSMFPANVIVMNILILSPPVNSSCRDQSWLLAHVDCRLSRKQV